MPRKAFYLNTKVCRYLPDVDKMFDFRGERVIQSVDESLQRLGVEYLDVVQVNIVDFKNVFVSVLRILYFYYPYCFPTNRHLQRVVYSRILVWC